MTSEDLRSRVMEGGANRHNRHWTPEERAEVLAAWDRGEARKVIARRLGRSHLGVKGIIERHTPKQGRLPL